VTPYWLVALNVAVLILAIGLAITLVMLRLKFPGDEIEADEPRRPYERVAGKD
jgi:hypothetical protein